MNALIDGIRMSWTDRQLRPYIIKPFAWTLVSYLILGFTLGWLFSSLVSPQLIGWGMPEFWAAVVSRIAFFLAWGLIGGAVFFMINGIFSSLLWDDLSCRAELQIYGHAPTARTTFRRSIGDSIRRMPYACGIGLLSLILGFTPLFWLAVWPVGQMSVVDFTAPAFARRGLYYPAQKRAAQALRGQSGFALAAGLISLFPLVNALCLPGCIIGATMLVRRSEEALQLPPMREATTV